MDDPGIPGLETSEVGIGYQEDVKPFIPPKPTLDDVSDDMDSEEDDDGRFIYKSKT